MSNLIEGNRFSENGVVGEDHEHNTYVEAIGAVYQYNYYGKLKDGAFGATLKDRSAGTVVRYNYIEATARALDLVDAEESRDITAADPSYRDTYVYGNEIYNGPGDSYSSLLIHYGGDKWVPEFYRKGTLHFYNNTVLNICDQKDRYGTMIFDITDGQESVDARNNIFYNAPYTTGEVPTEMGFMRGSEQGTDGNINFGVNWVSPGWIPYQEPVYDGSGERAWNGSFKGAQNFISNSGNNPGFVNLSKKDVALTSSSQCIDKAEVLPASILSKYDVTGQYSSTGTYQLRTPSGAASDLGAFEFISIPTLKDLQKVYNTKLGDILYNKNFDLNSDNIIDIFDLVLLARKIN